MCGTIKRNLKIKHEKRQLNSHSAKITAYESNNSIRFEVSMAVKIWTADF
jgi:hypothetical protein